MRKFFSVCVLMAFLSPLFLLSAPPARADSDGPNQNPNQTQAPIKKPKPDPKPDPKPGPREGGADD